jgi:serine/threonine protein kinase
MANTGTSGALPNEPLIPGTTLQHRYQIERLLGGGGMGMVYLAHDQRLANRACAVKEMVDHFIDQQQRIEANEYFAREADTLAQLKHSAIPAITDRFDDQNRHYLVMEYVEGRNLEEEIAARGGPLPEGLIIDIARQLCDVLAYLHGSTPPVIYRDMKPSNVMLTPKGRVVLIDFGIARLFKSARKGTMIGTLGFAPPEQYQGAVDPRSDIYSLGATLHYVLTGRDPEKYPPFSFPPVRDLRPEVSTNLAGAIDHALAYQADARPANIQDFRDMLLYGKGLGDAMRASAVTSHGGTAGLVLPAEPAEPIAPPHHRRRRRKHRAIALAAFFAVVAGGAFGATYVYNNPELQRRLGVESFIDSLPWKVEERLDAAKNHPLDFQRMTLQLSTRSGTPLSSPRASFTNIELANNQYLQWNASFVNRLAGLKGQDEKVGARFFSPSGLQIASSDASRFLGPAETTANFSGVALMPDLGALPPGNYKVGIYVNDRPVAEQAFSVSQDLAALRAAEAADAAEKAREAADKTKARDEAERLAMLEARRRKPLQLATIEFVNSTKSGTELSAATTSFNASKVLFVNWRITFENRLFNLDTGQYRVDAAYIAPDGHTLGSVDDIRIIPPTARSATFSGRVGNSAGGAFMPGQYTVNFYLNGQYVAQKKFRVLADTSQPYPTSLGATTGAGAGPPATGTIDVPTLATGRIDGLAGENNIPLELRLRPQPNGFLHGEMVIHLANYGATPIQGFIRGNHVEFQVPYGAKTLYFDGRRSADQLNGTFSATPSGERGTWTTVTN